MNVPLVTERPRDHYVRAQDYWYNLIVKKLDWKKPDGAFGPRTPQHPI